MCNETPDDVKKATIAKLETELRRRGMPVVYPMEMSLDLKISVLQNFITANDLHALGKDEGSDSEP